MNITDLINKKKEITKISMDQAKMVDLNKPLIDALFAIDIYGKEASDNSILEIIIGGGGKKTRMTVFEKAWDEALKRGPVELRAGRYYTSDNKILYRPKTRS